MKIEGLEYLPGEPPCVSATLKQGAAIAFVPDVQVQVRGERFAARAEQADVDELQIVAEHCPFGDAVVEHPVICAVDRGIVKGMLGSLYGPTAADHASSLPNGDDVCVTHVSL